MKKLQNNFTSVEQTKQLLEYGVPADSADMVHDGYIDSARRWVPDQYPRFLERPFSAEIKDDSELYVSYVLPCWSAGRLIELYEMCSGKRFERFDDGSSIMQDAFNTIVYLRNELDFSKLYNDEI